MSLKLQWMLLTTVFKKVYKTWIVYGRYYSMVFANAPIPDIVVKDEIPCLSYRVNNSIYDDLLERGFLMHELIAAYCNTLKLGSRIAKNYSQIEAETHEEFLAKLLAMEIRGQRTQS